MKVCSYQNKKKLPSLEIIWIKLATRLPFNEIATLKIYFANTQIFTSQAIFLTLHHTICVREEKKYFFLFIREWKLFSFWNIFFELYFQLNSRNYFIHSFHLNLLNCNKWQNTLKPSIKSIVHTIKANLEEF